MFFCVLLWNSFILFYPLMWIKKRNEYVRFGGGGGGGMESNLVRRKDTRHCFELTTRTSQPVYNRVYRIGTVCLTVFCVRQA